MRKNYLNYLVDLVSLLLMSGLLVTGLVMCYVLPPGTGGRGGGHPVMLWGGTRHDWGSVHFWICVGLVVLLLVHLILHWSWVCATTRRLIRGPEAACGVTRRFTRILYGSAAAAVAVIGFGGLLWVASVSAVRTDARLVAFAEREATAPIIAPNQCERTLTMRVVDGHSQRCEGENHLQGVQGSMTLRAVASAGRVSPDQLRDRLGLPATASLDERLGRLRRQFSFEMSEVRLAVQELTTHPLSPQASSVDHTKSAKHPQECAGRTRLPVSH